MRHHQTVMIGKIFVGHILLGLITFVFIRFGMYPESEPMVIYLNIVLGAIFSLICLSEYFGLIATVFFTIVLWLTPFHSLVQHYNVSWAMNHWKLMAVIVIASIAFGLSRLNHAQGFFAALRNQLSVLLLLFAVIAPLTGLDLDAMTFAITDNIDIAIHKLM